MSIGIFAAIALLQASSGPIATETTSPEKMGVIVMYRPGSIIGAAGGCPIRYKGHEIVELGRNKFAEWQVPPGRYILTNKDSSLEVSVMPGETCYVRCRIEGGFLSSGAELQIVGEESFAEHADDYERKEVSAP